MKKLFALAAILALAFTACESGNNGGETPQPSTNANLKLKLTSKSVMEFESIGGNGEITFEFIEEETRSAAPAAVVPTTPAEWLTNFEVKSNSVTFFVEPNDGEERSALITLKYGEQRVMVSVEQSGILIPDVTFNATHVSGTYFGKFITEKGVTAFNYFVILGDMRADHYLSKQDRATEYRFDLYSEVSSAFNTTHRVPVGTYRIDHGRTGRAGTIDGYYNSSYYFNTNYATVAYQNATLVVTEDSIIADVTFFDGQVHHIEYHGDCVFEDYIQETYADVYPVSQYTKDITFNIKNGHVNASYRGDYYGTGCDVWFIDMIEEKGPYNGVYLIFDLLIPKSGGYDNLDAIVGEYTIFNEKPESYEYTIPVGRLRDDCLQMHAWYLNCIQSQVDMSQAAPFTSGTIKVTKDGNAYVFDIDGTDDNGNKIVGKFSGLLSNYFDQSK